MFENIVSFFKKLSKKNNPKESSTMAKERLHLVLMQDRANVSVDFLELMRQEIIEVIKKYIDIDEKAIDVKLTNKTNEDGTIGAPALYANIPIITIKDEARKLGNAQANVIKDDKKESNTEKNQEPEKVTEKQEEQDKEVANKEIEKEDSKQSEVKQEEKNEELNQEETNQDEEKNNETKVEEDKKEELQQEVTEKQEKTEEPKEEVVSEQKLETETNS